MQIQRECRGIARSEAQGGYIRFDANYNTVVTRGSALTSVVLFASPPTPSQLVGNAFSYTTSVENGTAIQIISEGLYVIRCRGTSATQDSKGAVTLNSTTLATTTAASAAKSTVCWINTITPSGYLTESSTVRYFYSGDVLRFLWTAGEVLTGAVFEVAKVA